MASFSLLTIFSIIINFDAILNEISFKCLEPFPFKTFIASITSRLLPTASPRGSFILVIIALVFLPNFFPRLTINFERLTADSTSFISRTKASVPSAIFFERMEDAIKLTLSTVAVASLSEYKSLSAGTIFSL